MPHLGVPELLIILVIIVVVFGVGRLGDLGGALGKGISEFKKASSGDPAEDEKKKLAEASKNKESDS